MARELASTQDPEGARPRLPPGETIIALGVLALAGLVFWQTLAIPVSPLYARVGPTVIPMLTALGLAVCGAGLLVQALRGGWQDPEEKAIAPDRGALLLLASAFLANMALIGPAGFAIASTVLFALTARAFGSRNLLRDAATGFSLAIVSYLGFARALGINIGAGPLERAIERFVAVFV